MSLEIPGNFEISIEGTGATVQAAIDDVTDRAFQEVFNEYVDQWTPVGKKINKSFIHGPEGQKFQNSIYDVDLESEGMGSVFKNPKQVGEPELFDQTHTVYIKFTVDVEGLYEKYVALMNSSGIANPTVEKLFIDIDTTGAATTAPEPVNPCEPVDD